MKISVVIIAKNEERVIADCIKSASFAQEVIVIDAESTDSTVQIAESLGAKVTIHPWQGYGEQKNFGASKAISNWILFLDADERISDDLRERIAAMPEDTTAEVYWITIEDIFLGRRMKYLIGHNPRLVKKGTASWSNKKVHEQLLYIDTKKAAKYKDGISGELEDSIIHQSYTSIAAYLKKMHRYTTLDAADMKATGHHRSGRAITDSFFLPYILGIRQTIKLLFYRKGILDGWQGITWSILSGYYEFEMGKKYLQL